MPGLKRLGLILLVLLGPGSFIYFLAKTVRNKFLDLPYVGEHSYTYDSDGNAIDSVMYTVPYFELTDVEGNQINNNTINDNFIVLSTIQNSCPDNCGLFFLHFDEIFYSKLYKNQESYGNVKIISILTDHDGNPMDSISPKLIDELNEIEGYDPDIWKITTGDPEPLFSFKYQDKVFSELPSTPSNHEIGTKAFINSLVLIDKEGHIRGFTGARTFSDVSNFFDLLKVLKKAEFDKAHGIE